MTINQVQLANTFNVWRIRTNQLIDIGNDLKEGNLLTTGTMSLSNPSGFQSNVTLNITSGMIAGDGGLLSNVGPSSSITNQKLQNSGFSITTTQKQINLSSPTISLGDSIVLSVSNLTTSNTDTSVANIASANLVNSVHKIATFGSTTSMAAFDRANAANALALSAYDIAVAANTLASIGGNTISGIAGSVDSKYDKTGGAITGNVSVSGTVSVAGGMSIAGSLFVGGNTYFVDTTTLNVADPLLFLSANNTADAIDIGFVGRYVNATSDTVLTGMFRDATSKEYYVFHSYSGDILNNNIDLASNNFTVAMLNTNIRTSNLILNGVNAFTSLTNAYNTANSGYATASASYDKANAANILALTASVKANLTSVGTPAAKIGATNDVPAMIRISNTHIYVSQNTYTGSANVWKSVPLAGDFGAEAPYMLLPYYFGALSLTAANGIIFMTTAVVPFYLPASLTGSYSRSRQAAGGLTCVLSIQKNGSNVGTINFAQSSNTATFTMGSAVEFVPGDVLTIVNNPVPDTSINDVSFSILGYRR